MDTSPLESLPNHNPDSVHFTTLGMFIIDEIHYGPSKARRTATDILGGAGTYALLGARLFSPPPLSRTLHWIVDAGSDFPDSCRKHLESLNTHLHLRSSQDRLTTKGYNSYLADGRSREDRAFRYLTPKLRLTVEDLEEQGIQGGKCIHLICGPQRCLEEVSKLRRSSSAGAIIVWEPVPDLCTPKNRDPMLQAAREVDVISPNDGELAGFFTDGSVVPLEELASRIVVGDAGDGAVVVRAGRSGCYVKPGTESNGTWLPAYYEGTDVWSHEKVIDPTGGGNTFVGALGVGLARGRGILFGAAMGAVAASFAIEQIGLPSLRSGEDAAEWWNDDSVELRLADYFQRLHGRGIELDPNACRGRFRG